MLRLICISWAVICQYSWAVGKTGRGVGEGAGNQWVKLGDWELGELGDHVSELCYFDSKLENTYKSISE